MSQHALKIAGNNGCATKSMILMNCNNIQRRSFRELQPLEVGNSGGKASRIPSQCTFPSLIRAFDGCFEMGLPGIRPC